MNSFKKEEIVKHLTCNKNRNILKEADSIRKEHCGDEVHIRGIIEFSNYCKRDCLYCGLRKSNKKLTRYRMTADEIFKAARKVEEFKYKTIVLQSGEDDYYRIEELCGLVKRIKKEIDCAVTLSIGERTYDEYKQLREAGADRYLLKFETSNKKLFVFLKPGSLYEKRLKRLEWLRDLGYQVGSGNMVGLPGQTLEMLADDILLMNKLDLDMIGIGPFIPHPDTPLWRFREGTLELTLKTIALTRMAAPDAYIPATTAAGSVDPAGRQKALQCGANVIMPNMTPQKYRKYYEIYPDKICLNDQPGDCRMSIKTIIESLGRNIARGYGGQG
ncbi:MAG: [FeFe] hydrogenase H-cluster radical SAM maturase HydE [Candidatus Omnitrophica bacterium 4484_171]|nr:MAG: [FeFe] hydrogenase H-cluster radical SAM maturase HydE [Candidatus Omnitrophica bacterium 4484_171]